LSEAAAPDRPLQNQVAAVTGGGGGIGSAIARRLARAGAAIVITYRADQAKAEAAAAALDGDEHLVVRASVTESAALEALAQQVRSRYGRLDVLVNNAGISRPVPHDDLTGLDDAFIDAIFQTNWRGAFACVRAFRSLLEEGEGGLIVNVSSIAGRTAVGSNVAYCASKAALDSMTMSLARALAPNIRCISISPGWVDGDYARRADPVYLQEQIDKTPLQRIARAADVADAVYAAAVDLRFTNGAIIPVDGGRPLN
jgi:3-oxoacyl-[acyl-carrier protein] reductase